MGGAFGGYGGAVGAGAWAGIVGVGEGRCHGRVVGGERTGDIYLESRAWVQCVGGVWVSPLFGLKLETCESRVFELDGRSMLERQLENSCNVDTTILN